MPGHRSFKPCGVFQVAGDVLLPLPGGQQLLPQGNHIREVQIVNFASAVVAGSAGVIQPAAQVDHCRRAGMGFQIMPAPPTQGHSAAWPPPARRTAASGYGNFSPPLKNRKIGRADEPRFHPGKRTAVSLPGIQREDQRLHGTIFVFHRFLSVVKIVIIAASTAAMTAMPTVPNSFSRLFCSNIGFMFGDRPCLSYNPVIIDQKPVLIHNGQDEMPEACRKAVRTVYPIDTDQHCMLI